MDISGVVGLTAALHIQLQGNYRVTVISEIIPGDPKSIKYTSNWAVGCIFIWLQIIILKLGFICRAQTIYTILLMLGSMVNPLSLVKQRYSCCYRPWRNDLRYHVGLIQVWERCRRVLFTRTLYIILPERSTRRQCIQEASQREPQCSEISHTYIDHAVLLSQHFSFDVYQKVSLFRVLPWESHLRHSQLTSRFISIIS